MEMEGWDERVHDAHAAFLVTVKGSFAATAG
jgi:hypothetical protein